ncbi:MAG: hypothetical protein H6712_10370 [Myxococcales bacterium]|nr:hypothetical protein [Myxococcales bacterium]
MRAVPRRWWWLAVGLVAMGLAAAIHGAFHGLAPSHGRPVPALGAVPWGLAAAGELALLVSPLAIWRGLATRGRRVGAVVVHLVLLVGAPLGVLASDPDFPFGPACGGSLALPGDRGTAYLCRGGLFCSRTVRIARPGSWWTRPDDDFEARRCEGEAELRWDARREAVELVGDDGRPVPRPESWGPALDLRPH